MINFKQLLKFGAVGVIATAIDYGLMVFLTEIFNVRYLLSCAISFSVSVIFNYFLSVKYVFNVTHKTSKSAEILIFVFLSVIGLMLNQFLMWWTVERLSINYLIAKIIATVIVMGYNYISRKCFLEERSNSRHTK